MWLNVLAVRLFPFNTSGVLIPLSHVYDDVEVTASRRQLGSFSLGNSAMHKFLSRAVEGSNPKKQ